MKKENKRLVLVCYVMGIFCIMLISRLGYIQLIKGHKYAKEALKQKTNSFSLKARGEILDRNQMSLCDSSNITYANIAPRWLSPLDKQLLIDIGILENMDDNEPRSIAVSPENINPLKTLVGKTPGIYLYEKNIRYGKGALATHVIGYNAETGIEKTFDAILQSEGEESIIFSDGLGQTIGGISKVVSNSVPQKVILTIDREKQDIVEDIMDKKIKKGAVVVLDAENGEILAMASRPNYKQYNLEEYFSKENAPLINRAVESYPPGSIFKIVVLSAAFEEQIATLDTLYTCNGFEKVGGNIFTCPSYKNGGHGEITLQDAMAYSCNAVFIQLGLQLGKDKLLEYARAFGFGDEVIIGLPEEKPGNIPDPSKVYYQDLGNLSMGQGAIDVTPLQVAQMVLTVVNNGVLKKPVLIKEAVDKYGKRHYPNKGQGDTRVISEMTAKKVMRSLMAAARYGTGILAMPDSSYEIAGKTGTAEVSENEYHAWFAGFYPAHAPKYVICVFVEKGGSGAYKAAPIFRDILEGFSTLAN